MNETLFYFSRGDALLFGILHEPSTVTRLPFVFCHPFGEEKLWTHRVYVSFARELAERGHVVLRFDFHGNGESGGDFTESSIGSAIADIESAIELTKERTGASQVGLLGVRLGASLAFKVAARRSDVKSLVLWAPILDGSRYLQELLRINVTTQLAVYREVRQDREELTGVLEAGGTVNVDGYDMGPDMARQLRSLALANEQAVPAARCLIAVLDQNRASKPPRDIEDLCARLPNGRITMVPEDQFWKEIVRFYYAAPNLFTATLEWLEGSSW
jgi:exosortase A-associated hydrolase 2